MENKDKPKNYILYARKSTESEDRQVASIESQVDEMKKVAESFGLKISHIMTEASSGFKIGRVVFNQMLSMIENGEADGIICWKISRLSRNPDDAGRIMGMLQRGEIKHIRTHSRDWFPDDNVLMMYVEFGLTNQFSKDLQDDTARGLRQKAQRGWKPTAQLSLGYLHNMGNKKVHMPEDEIVVDPDRFEILKKGLEVVASRRMTPKQSVAYVNELGLRTKKGKRLGYSAYYRMLGDTFYYGAFEFPRGSGNWITGKHPKMITKDTFDSIQEVLGRKNAPRPQKHYFSYTGLMICGECGCSISAGEKYKTQKNGNKHHYTYYQCTHKRGNCKQPTIEVKELERQFIEEINAIYIPPEFAEWAINELKKDFEKEKIGRNESLEINEKNHKSCLARIDKLVESWLDGDVPKDIYKKKMAELEKEKGILLKILNDTDQSVDNWLQKAEKFFDFAVHAKERFENGDLSDKKEIIAFLGLNLSIKDRIATIDIPKPIEKIKERALQARELKERFEPIDLPVNKGKFEETLANDSSWGGRRDSNPRQPAPQAGALPAELRPPFRSSLYIHHLSFFQYNLFV